MKTGKYFFASTTLVFFFLFVLSSKSSYSQKESVIYIGTNGKLTTIGHAVQMHKILTQSTKQTTIQTYQLNDAKWEKLYSEKYKMLNDSTYQIRRAGRNSKGTFFRTFRRLPDKTFEFRDMAKKNIVRSGFAKSVVPLLLHGQVTEFYPEGNKKSISEYSENELITNENWEENGDRYIDDIFYSTDTYPAFKPGTKVLNDHLIKSFKDAGIDFTSIVGQMTIGFVVMEDGTIDGVKVIKGMGPNINGIACQAFKSLKGAWTPAKLNNENVRYFQVFPINFINKETHFQFAEIGKGNLSVGF